MDVHETRHISLFALAPIPLLVYLGSQLSNKVPVDVFQRHRDTEDWVWKDSGTPAEYRFDKIREGSGQGRIALILSLSGKIKPEALPSGIDEQFTIYELTLANMEPNPTLSDGSGTISRSFKDAYQAALRTIARECGRCDAIHLFPAVPLRSLFSAAGNFFRKSIPSCSSTTTTSVWAALLQVIEVNQHMTADEYLHDVLDSQALGDDSDEVKALQKHRADVEKLLRDNFKDSALTIRYAGSKAKGTMNRESYDLDIISYFASGDNTAGETLQDIYENTEKALGKKYSVEPKGSALRLKSCDPENLASIFTSTWCRAVSRTIPRPTPTSTSPAETRSA